jgi:hypothetical protein
MVTIFLKFSKMSHCTWNGPHMESRDRSNIRFLVSHKKRILYFKIKKVFIEVFTNFHTRHHPTSEISQYLVCFPFASMTFFNLLGIERTQLNSKEFRSSSPESILAIEPLLDIVINRNLQF